MQPQLPRLRRAGLGARRLGAGADPEPVRDRCASELGLGYLFITHDLAVVRQVVDRVYVFHRGEIVEEGDVDDVLDAPKHPYTEKLIASVPRSSAAWLGPVDAAVGIAGFWHETNSFSPKPTDLDDFAGATGALLRGADEMATGYATDCPTAGFATIVRGAGLPLAPVVDAWAWPSGTITRATFAALADAIVDGLLEIEQPSAFLLSLHGAAVAEGCGDPEGAIERLRAARPRVPIGVVLDHHAGVSEELVAASDIVVGYKTEPHVDLVECGERAGRIALDLARGAIGRVERCSCSCPSCCRSGPAHDAGRSRG